MIKPPVPNLLERTMAVFAPKHAAKSFMARSAFYGVGQYSGARRDKTSMKAFNPQAGSADSDSIGDLATLRSRSRDLVRNAGIARGARNTSRVNIVGGGLRVRPMIERELVGLSEKQAEDWQSKASTLFNLWANSKLADITGEQSFYELQGVAFNGSFESGDIFAIRRRNKRALLGSVALALQLVEADRVCSPSDLIDRDIRDGIEVDEDGAKVAIYVRNRHPGDDLYSPTYKPEAWSRISAKGVATGEALFIHLFDKERVGQTRGIPALAPVIEDLKQLDRYSEAELMAAVVSAFFTVFIKSDGSGDQDGNILQGEEVGPHGPVPYGVGKGEVALGSGSVVELGTGESIETANPARPNVNFEPFFLAIVKKIGVSLGIPHEVLIMHFTASYSASRAALETAWQFFTDRRTWLARNFCQPAYEWWLYEAVALGLLEAPGFFEDPIKRAAYCNAEWIGPARIVLDPMKEAEAEEKWLELGVKTLDAVTTAQTGGDWWRNQEQRKREVALRRQNGLEAELPLDPNSPEAIKAKAAAKPKPEQGGSDRETA